MKSLSWLSVLLFSASLMTCRQAQDELPATQLAVPIKLVDGYGPFHPGFSALGNEFHDDPGREKQWGKTRLAVTGIPKHWSSVEKSMVWLNANQLVYQNYIAGNIPLKRYQDLQGSWKWTPDETRLSKKPIECYVYTLRGYDVKEGKWAVMIDTNNNLDFSDEKPVYPKPIDNKNPYAYENPTLVHYEVYRKGKVEAAQISMVVKTFQDRFLYNFPQHATAVVEREGKKYELVVSSGFTTPDFERTGLVQKSTFAWSEQERVKPEDVVELRENITLGGVRYKNKGVDLYNNVLQLDPLSSGDREYSLQVGYPFRPFADKEFGSGKPIALADYKGKYVYVDFWGTGCRGCVQDLPELKKLYDKLDKQRFEFVGITDGSSNLDQFLDKYQVNWPQIQSNKTNRLFDQYDVIGLPTSVLLDPNGTVIAKNLRPERLQAKIAELSR